MGIFDKLFSSKERAEVEDTTPWIALEHLEQLDDLVERSKTKPQLIFKHSTRCGISRMVIGQFKKDYPFTETEADLYYLDLLNHREISNNIANRFGIMHESPQLLVVKDGVVVVHASHGDINDLELAVEVK